MRRVALPIVMLLGTLAVSAVLLIATQISSKRPGATAVHQVAPRAAARAFFESWARYLAGHIPRSELAYATHAVTLDAGPPLPAENRVAVPRLVLLEQTASDQYYARLETQGSTCEMTATVTPGAPPSVTDASGGCPDGLSAAAGASGQARPRQAAQAFLHPYLAALYGHAPVDAIPDIAGSLRTKLEQHLHTPAGLRALDPRITSDIAMKAVSSGWQAWAEIADGEQTYTLVIALASEKGRWLVKSVTSP